MGHSGRNHASRGCLACSGPGFEAEPPRRKENSRNRTLRRGKIPLPYPIGYESIFCLWPFLIRLNDRIDLSRIVRIRSFDPGVFCSLIHGPAKAGRPSFSAEGERGPCISIPPKQTSKDFAGIPVEPCPTPRLKREGPEKA